MLEEYFACESAINQLTCHFSFGANGLFALDEDRFGSDVNFTLSRRWKDSRVTHKLSCGQLNSGLYYGRFLRISHNWSWHFCLRLHYFRIAKISGLNSHGYIFKASHLGRAALLPGGCNDSEEIWLVCLKEQASNHHLSFYKGSLQRFLYGLFLKINLTELVSSFMKHLATKTLDSSWWQY